jgi:hypothetical protein
MKRAAAALSLCGIVTLALAQPAKPPPPGGQPQLPSGHPQVQAPPVAAEWPKADPKDVASIDALLDAYYASTSGNPGQPRQWDRFKSLFVPDARLIAVRPGGDGSSGAGFLTVSDYVGANKNYFEKGGFFDREVGRKTEEFASIASVWSTFESRHKSDDATPYVRGIAAMQLMKDKNRWWIVNVVWDFERPDAPVPAKYLQKAGG